MRHVEWHWGEQHNWRQAQAMPSQLLGATTLSLGSEKLTLQTTEPSYCRREKQVYQWPRKGADLAQGARAEETPTQRPHVLSTSLSSTSDSTPGTTAHSEDSSSRHCSAA